MSEHIHQLLRYAQDLDDLMEQHARLQERHQALLQREGRVGSSNDLLLELVSRSRRPLAVTDMLGNFMRSNRAAQQILRGLDTSNPAPVHIADVVPASEQVALEGLLARFATDNASEAAVLCRFRLHDPDHPGRSQACAMLVAPLRTQARTGLYWMLLPLSAAEADAPVAPERLLPLEDESSGVFVTDPGTRILAVNTALCSITDFNADELLGRTANLLASGRHTAEFYGAFWTRLLARGCWSGEILNRRRTGAIYSAWKTVKAIHDMQGALLYYLSVDRDISDLNSSVEELSQLAYFDGLTGLPNRRLLEDRMSQAIHVARRDITGLSVLYIDLDNFKPINDQFSHAAGDLVLQQVSARMRASLRGGDTVARVGGDEFVVLLPGACSPADIEVVVSTLLAQIGAPLMVGEHSVSVGASVGCAFYPADGEDGEILIRNADTAMFRGKQNGGHRVAFYRSLSEAPHRSTLGLDLWGAAERGELRLLFQPKVSIAAPHRLRGCEALARWTHPVHGEIGPDLFIPLAEISGAILPIGRWVLAEVCQSMRRWLDDGLGDFSLAVNISYRQVQEPAFCNDVRAILQRTGLPPELLELEITESACGLLANEHWKQLQSLRELGVKIAIDDFGVGYSSLNRLASLRADCLKIDRRFVCDIDTSAEARALCNCAVGLGIAMGMEVVAEGVETQAQIDVLAGQGCHVLQGYLISQPMAADRLPDWIRGRASGDAWWGSSAA